MVSIIGSIPWCRFHCRAATGEPLVLGRLEQSAEGGILRPAQTPRTLPAGALAVESEVGVAQRSATLFAARGGWRAQRLVGIGPGDHREDVKPLEGGLAPPRRTLGLRLESSTPSTSSRRTTRTATQAILATSRRDRTSCMPPPLAEPSHGNSRLRFFDLIRVLSRPSGPISDFG